jgi:hypothetical protein
LFEKSQTFRVTNRRISHSTTVNGPNQQASAPITAERKSPYVQD